MTLTTNDLQPFMQRCIDECYEVRAKCDDMHCKFYDTVNDCSETINFMSIEATNAELLPYAEGECPHMVTINPGYTSSLTVNQNLGIMKCSNEEVDLAASDCKTQVACALKALDNVFSSAYNASKMKMLTSFFNNAFYTNLYYELNPSYGTSPITPTAANQQYIYTAPDGQPLIGTHFWASTANSFNNQAVNNAPLSASSLMQAFIHGKHQIRDSVGNKMCVNYDTLYVVACSPAEIEAKRLLEQYQKITPNQLDQQNVFRGDPEGCFNFKICHIPAEYAANMNMWFLHDSTFWKRQGAKYNNSFVFYERFKLKVMNPHVDACGKVCSRSRYMAGAGIWSLPVDWYGSNGSGMAPM